MRLIPIQINGTLEGSFELDSVASDAMAASAKLYKSAGFTPPWIGYAAEKGGEIVGTCGFKSAPKAGRVEIAYYTFPDYEHNRMGGQMTQALVALGREADPKVTMTARTTPEESASTSILKRIGFTKVGTVENPEEGTVWQWELPGAA